jgi:hypothetical protein
LKTRALKAQFRTEECDENGQSLRGQTNWVRRVVDRIGASDVRLQFTDAT